MRQLLLTVLEAELCRTKNRGEREEGEGEKRRLRERERDLFNGNGEAGPHHAAMPWLTKWNRDG
jgi:hypothetical protein